MSHSDVVLELNDLHTHFFTDAGEIPAVDGVSINVHKGEVVGIVGESGCGKSVTSLSIMHLVPRPPGRIVNGEINFKGENLAHATEARMKKIRGNEISMIFQEPMTSLDPLFTIGNQMGEAIRLHQKMSKKEARRKSIDMLKLVEIPRPEAIIDEYPHQLSGGMRQRVMIAMSMSCDPELLIADEPTTALDVTIQAQILDLMRSLNKEKDTAILLITHDLGVVAEICDRVTVMYSGQVVEEGTMREILKDPKHPYSKGLIRSLPKIHEREQKLYSIPGTVPKPKMERIGCHFAPRCEFAFDRCFGESPKLYSLGNNRVSRCFLYDEKGGKEGAEAENAESTIRS
ncbi:peptide/nickel transport system ATP-binding protein [Virgibacillus natechei]|uniref:Peptide/nickel transport system ATP-binding protein n=1 Tax=Virgibacillus natechei TaxID=1216297 RepID=A0ABS4IGI1_9BACI|nr:ABC transporter ATP-binding protein [Virgibacillus natechei]MBP1969426.1 peptide/nickel transport system ATP-binding protein [Virgibacillus natechei]UZD11862.1 ABC transporter ATP-binding protein [Virgibacillus natechei]